MNKRQHVFSQVRIVIIFPLLQRATVLFFVLFSSTHLKASPRERNPHTTQDAPYPETLPCLFDTAHRGPPLLPPTPSSAPQSDPHQPDPASAPAPEPPRPRPAGARPTRKHDPPPPTAAPGPQSRRPARLDPPRSRASLHWEPGVREGALRILPYSQGSAARSRQRGKAGLEWECRQPNPGTDLWRPPSSPAARRSRLHAQRRQRHFRERAGPPLVRRFQECVKWAPPSKAFFQVT